MNIAITYYPSHYVLDEDSEFTCPHTEAYVENPKDPTEAMWVCPDCEAYGYAKPDGIDDEGHLEYATPTKGDWND